MFRSLTSFSNEKRFGGAAAGVVGAAGAGSGGEFKVLLGSGRTFRGGVGPTNSPVNYKGYYNWPKRSPLY